MSPNRPNRHHFVPRWYLEGFAEGNSGFLNVYDKKTDTWRRQKPKQVMTINHYYRQQWVPKGVDPDIFERVLANEVENYAATAFHKALFDRDNLTAEDTAALLYHLEMQRIRVPSYADLARTALVNLLLPRLKPAVAAAVVAGKLDIDIRESFRFDAMRGAAGVLVPYYEHMDWQIGTAEPPYTFVTSDNPVTFFNVNHPPPSVPGLGQFGTIVIYPIDATHILTLRHPEWDGNPSSADNMLPQPNLFDGALSVLYTPIVPRAKVQAFNEINLKLAKRTVVGSSKAVLEETIGKALAG